MDTDASSVSDEDADDYIKSVSRYLEDPKRWLTPRYIAFLRERIHFFNPNQRLFQLDSHLAAGAAAKAYIFNEINEAGIQLRQVIIKIAHDPSYDAETQKEINILDLLRRSNHIVNTINVERSGLRRPILIMEYLKNGSLYNLQRRILHADMHIPNRVLWSIFLCCK